jgi:hypothetical protein
MSAKNKTDKTDKTTEALYTKEQLLSSKKYHNRVDLLNVLLEDNVKYTHKEVEQLIDKFMKGEVK